MSTSDHVVPGSDAFRRAYEKYKQQSHHFGRWIDQTQKHALELCSSLDPLATKDPKHKSTLSNGPSTELRSTQGVGRQHSHPLSNKAARPTARRSRIPAPIYQPKRYARCSEVYLPLENPVAEVDQTCYTLPHPQLNLQDSYPYSLSECHKIITRLENELGSYPQRPDFSLRSSPPVDALRKVLAGAPTSPKDPRMNVFYDKSGHSIYTWGDRYMDQLFQALIRVIKYHGVGADGWGSIRWEVYDKYSTCVGGIGYVRTGSGPEGMWHDAAKDWLRGDHRGYSKPSNDILKIRRYRSLGKGAIYNKMLPVTTF